MRLRFRFLGSRLTFKTLLAVALIALTTTLTTIYTIHSVDGLYAKLKDINSIQVERLVISQRLVQQAESLGALMLGLVQAPSNEKRLAASVELNDRLSWMDKLIVQLQASSETDKPLLERLALVQRNLALNAQALDQKAKERAEVRSRATFSNDAELRKLLGANRELSSEFALMAGYFSSEMRNKLREQNTQLELEFSQLRQRILWLTALVLLSVLVVGGYFERHVVRRILMVQRAVEADGVKPDDLQDQGRDEISRLTHTIARFVRAIRANEEQMQLTNQELAFLAEHDPLTKLANRRHFDAAARAMLSKSPSPLCLVIADIDRFKDVNDTYGHDVGDKALVHVAQLLQSTTRDNDVLARTGGEEFTAILPVESLSAGMELCERIRIQIESHPLILSEQLKLPITLSLGMVLIEGLPRKKGETLMPQLLKNGLRAADLALYKAKQTGRNRVCVAPAPLNAALMVSEES